MGSQTNVWGFGLKISELTQSALKNMRSSVHSPEWETTATTHFVRLLAACILASSKNTNFASPRAKLTFNEIRINSHQLKFK